MTALNQLVEREPERVQAVLNLLVECPYFYRSDNEELFFFLRRYRREFSDFYTQFYGWSLFIDDKCARAYKSRWYNDKVTEANRDMFGFRRRDECLAFMILLEFFEHQLEEASMTVEDRHNLRFRLGDLLLYTHRRFRDLFPGEDGERYTEDYVRGSILRQVLPVLEKYRFVARLKPPAEVRVERSEVIYEAMPALYHYSAGRLGQAISDATEPTEPQRAAVATAGDSE